MEFSLYTLTITQVNSDRDIARITEMGFRPDEASSALKASNGDVQQAIESLLSRRGGPAGRGGTSRQSSYESRDGDRGVGRGRRDRKEDDEGRLWDLYFTYIASVTYFFGYKTEFFSLPKQSKRSRSVL